MTPRRLIVSYFKRLIPLLLGAALLAGCVEAQYRPASNLPALAPYQGEVRVLPRLPGYEHLVLGTLFVSGGLAVGESTMMDALREKAAAIGANAIVLQDKLRSTTSIGGTTTKLAAWAIRVP